MRLERKLTLNDLSLIGAPYKRLKPILKTEQYVLTHYKIIYDGIDIWARVMEYQDIQFVIRFDVIASAESEDELVSRMLEQLYEIKKAKYVEIRNAMKKGWRLDETAGRFISQSQIVAKLSWNRTFGRICILFIFVGTVLSVAYGIIPFVFLTLAGVDGVVLSQIWRKRILC